MENMSFIRDSYHVFNQNASTYEQFAKIPLEIGHRLFERLDYLKIRPNYILDLGCGPGVFSGLLKKRYPKAQIISLDIAEAMLHQAKSKITWRKPFSLVCADMHQLPFEQGLFDLIFANQVIHWSEQLTQVIQELNRVMNPNGCLMFSALGPDTFQELKSMQHEITHTLKAQFIDMHHIGDALLSARFLDPVVDMEMLTAQHKDLISLSRGLQQEGINVIPNPKTINKNLPITYEVFYGHAWNGLQHQTQQGIETYIPIATLKNPR